MADGITGGADGIIIRDTGGIEPFLLNLFLTRKKTVESVKKLKWLLTATRLSRNLRGVGGP